MVRAFPRALSGYSPFLQGLSAIGGEGSAPGQPSSPPSPRRRISSTSRGRGSGLTDMRLFSQRAVRIPAVMLDVSPLSDPPFLPRSHRELDDDPWKTARARQQLPHHLCRPLSTYLTSTRCCTLASEGWPPTASSGTYSSRSGISRTRMRDGGQGPILS
jgi:hypothetical protein